MTGPDDDEALGGLGEVRAAVSRACAAAGRDPASVTLVAASKTIDAPVLRRFVHAGLMVYGENRVQEAMAKWPSLREEFAGIDLSLIGPLQTNKAREAVATFDCVQSLDRPRLAAALARQIDLQGRKPRFLIQVNIAGEPQKAGVMPDQTDALVTYCREEQGLDVVGLMCIPPYDGDSRPYFEKMAGLAARNGLSELSMGMSQDFAEAIAHGATQVRVGTAIFGARYYPPGRSPADIALARAAARAAGGGDVSREARYDILFEPVAIGPVTTKNRFYQVPHCNGMGRAFPSSMAAMRGIKAEGGWGVVSTEQCDIHHSGNHLREIRLWDASDIGYLARAADQIHEHGALAAIELVHNGSHVPNLESRVAPIAPSLQPTRGLHPVTARAMDRADIAALRRWHRTAALNARAAGFDIVYVYAGHDMTLPVHFLSRKYNRRTDEYGGSLENRARLLRELIEDTKEAVGDRCAVAVRFGVDRLSAPAGQEDPDEARAVVEMLAELPDLWDVNLGRFDDDGRWRRFSPEAYQAEHVRWVKSVTTRPVVGVGRFTSPDTMVDMIRSGTLDLIGAARPSIADPFLPRKIEEGRFDDLRECIGCNVCLAYDAAGVPIRCTQNPTMGEEWRRGWHPEFIPAKDTDDRVLIVGGGPSGLEAAMSLGQRGYEVTLVERERTLGGRVARESRLPGLATWSRVRDHRLEKLRRMRNVDLVPGSDVTVEDVLAAGVTLVGLATGARWRADGAGRAHTEPLPGLGQLPVYTPDDVMDGRLPQGRVVLFDDHHDYLGAVVAERLAEAGCEVTFVTSQSMVSAYTQYTNDQPRVQGLMIRLCREVLVSTVPTRLRSGGVEVASVYGGLERVLAADAVVLVTGSVPQDELWTALDRLPRGLWEDAGLRRVVRLGDCLAPGTIAAAVHSGHLFARTLDTGLTDETPYRREHVVPDRHPSFPSVSESPGHRTLLQIVQVRGE